MPPPNPPADRNSAADSSFDAWLRAQYPRVYAVCQCRLRHAADAEDATQDVFRKYLESLATIRDCPEGWLLRCAEHTCVDLVRRAHRRRGREATRARDVADTTDALPTSGLEAREFSRRLLAELSDEDAELLRRHLVDRVPQAVLAAERGVTQQSISARVTRARRHLRLWVKQHLGTLGFGAALSSATSGVARAGVVAWTWTQKAGSAAGLLVSPKATPAVGTLGAALLLASPTPLLFEDARPIDAGDGVPLAFADPVTATHRPLRPTIPTRTPARSIGASRTQPALGSRPAAASPETTSPAKPLVNPANPTSRRVGRMHATPVLPTAAPAAPRPNINTKISTKTSRSPAGGRPKTQDAAHRADPAATLEPIGPDRLRWTYRFGDGRDPIRLTVLSGWGRGPAWAASTGGPGFTLTTGDPGPDFFDTLGLERARTDALRDALGSIDLNAHNLIDAIATSDDATLSTNVHTPRGEELRLDGTTRFLGEVSGAGHLRGDGTAVFASLHSPGDSPAFVEVDGSLVYTDTSRLHLELAGTGAGQYDRLTVAGDVTLAGALTVSVIDGFRLAAGQSFLVVSIDGERVGRFADLAEGSPVTLHAGLPGDPGWLGPGPGLFITYLAGDGNDVALYTLPTSPRAGLIQTVPEPTAAAILLVSVAALASRRPRRVTLKPDNRGA